MLGGTYEYLMSSLPHLSFLRTEELKGRVLDLLQKYAGPSSEGLNLIEILDREAKKYMPAKAFETFQKIDLDNIYEVTFQQSKNKVLSAFSKLTFDLKVEIMQWRSAQSEAEKKLLEDKLLPLLGQGTPLEKEVRILAYQWEQLEEISTGHFADVEALFAYKIKLMILLRWWDFQFEKGYNKFMQASLND